MTSDFDTIRAGRGRAPSDEGGPGNEETYWLRQKLQASIVHLRDIEDYFRLSDTPRSMDRADRARSLYEQISEDFVNGKTNRLTMRQRAEAAEARLAELEAEIWNYLLWEPRKKGHAAAHERLRAAVADHDTKEGT